MKKYFIIDTSTNISAIIEADLSKLKKVNEMYEALKEQIKLGKKEKQYKAYVKYGHSSSITKLKHHERLQQLESLLNEIDEIGNENN